MDTTYIATKKSVDISNMSVVSRYNERPCGLRLLSLLSMWMLKSGYYTDRCPQPTSYLTGSIVHVVSTRYYYTVSIVHVVSTRYYYTVSIVHVVSTRYYYTVSIVHVVSTRYYYTVSIVHVVSTRYYYTVYLHIVVKPRSKCNIRVTKSR